MASKRPLSTRRKGLPTVEKAHEILRHGEVHNQPLSPGQKGLFGLIAGGKKPTRLGGKRRSY